MMMAIDKTKVSNLTNITNRTGDKILIENSQIEKPNIGRGDYIGKIIIINRSIQKIFG
jgi:hypothetical protein